MIQLHKVLTNQWDELIRANYSEDLPLLAMYNQNAAQGLDLAVADALATIGDNPSVFKIEMPDGAMMGWFAITPPQQLNAWYIRKQCRTDELLSAFNSLIQQTFQYSLFYSTGVNNIDSSVLNEQNILQIQIPTLVYTGKNYVILKNSN